MGLQDLPNNLLTVCSAGVGARGARAVQGAAGTGVPARQGGAREGTREQGDEERHREAAQAHQSSQETHQGQSAHHVVCAVFFFLLNFGTYSNFLALVDALSFQAVLL